MWKGERRWKYFIGQTPKVSASYLIKDRIVYIVGLSYRPGPRFKLG